MQDFEVDKVAPTANTALHFGADISVFVQDVLVHNVKSTRRNALIKELSGLYNSRTLHELIVNSHLAAKHMEEVGIFEKCVPIIDTAKVAEDAYTVNFFAKEPSQLKCGANCGVSLAGDAEVNVKAMKASAFGAGESVSVTYKKLIKGGHSFDFTAVAPYLGWQHYANLAASLSRHIDTLRWNRSEVTQNSFVIEHNRRILSNRLNYTLRQNLSWRHFRPRLDASFSVNEHAGHTSKISVENILTYDTRDRPLLPTRGILARFANEFAGLVGDAAFVKNQLELQVATSLPYGWIFGASGRVASVDGLSGKNIHLLDRIYMGGAHDVRGFETNSIGTRVDGTSLGGALGLAGAVHFYKGLVPPDMLYGHLFLTAGSIGSVRSRRRLADALDHPRITAGVGLTFVYRNVARLEINYVQPLRIVAGDACAPGVYFGAGINFL